MFQMFKRRKTQRVPYHPVQKPRHPGALTPEAIEGLFDGCSDLEHRTVCAGGPGGVTVHVYWFDGLASSADIAQQILRPLTEAGRFSQARSEAACRQAVLEGAVYAAPLDTCDDLDGAARAILAGHCLMLFPRLRQAVHWDLKSSVQRSVASPEVEKTVKGGKDAFIEILRVNTALVRRRLHDPALKSARCVVGRKSATPMTVMWLDGVANPEIVQAVQQRLAEIDIDAVLTAGEVEQYLCERPGLPFPQLLHTERPDRFAAGLAAGCVGLLVDGLPLGFLMPATLPQLLRVTEDRAQHFWVASALTLLRWVALVATLLLPATYVAVAMYHQEMIPFKLLESVISAKQAVPFSTAAEVLGMLIAFELLQEAGLRLPNPIGETVSIIGALIVGQSAVEARVVSPIAVIVVALAGVCGYTQPSQDLGAAMRLGRFLLTIAAVLAGMFGVMVGTTLLVWLLCTMEFCGVAYLSPLCDADFRGWLRALLRLPRRWQKLREPALRTPDRRREK